MAEGSSKGQSGGQQDPYPTDDSSQLPHLDDPSLSSSTPQIPTAPPDLRDRGTYPRIYTFGRYSVSMTDDGAIQVKPGDSIGQYAGAIDGDVTQVNKYARPDKKKGALIPITQPSQINQGESIYHTPTHSKSAGAPASDQSSPVTPAEKKKAIEATVKLSYDIPGDNWPLFHKALEMTEFGDRAVGELVEDLAHHFEVLEGPVSAMTVLTALAFPIKVWVHVANAFDEPYQYYGMKADAWAVTAWAFGDPPPPLPRANLDNIRKNLPKGEAKFVAVWNNASRDAVLKLETQIVRNKRPGQTDYVLLKSYQQLLRAVADNNRARLARQLFDGFGKKLAPSHQMEYQRQWTDYPN